ncbi:MAG: hypothetical protein ACM336_00340 [Acidobacteriota bacterium]|nr:hypothetical protein [Bryobacteraceae bacterium]
MKLDEARVEALRQRIARWGSAYLNDDLYRALRWEGWTRGQVDRAIEHLIAGGRLVAEARDGVVRVRVTAEVRE